MVWAAARSAPVGASSAPSVGVRPVRGQVEEEMAAASSVLQMVAALGRASAVAELSASDRRSEGSRTCCARA